MEAKANGQDNGAANGDSKAMNGSGKRKAGDAGVGKEDTPTKKIKSDEEEDDDEDDGDDDG